MGTIHIGLMYTEKYAWGRASDKQILQYKSNLDNMLNGIKCDKDVLGCANEFCNEHIDKVNVLYQDIISACILSSELCIPKTGTSKDNKPSSKSVNIPGWSEYVEPLTLS